MIEETDCQRRGEAHDRQKDTATEGDRDTYSMEKDAEGDRERHCLYKADA